MLRLMVSYAKYIIELPNVQILISLSLGSNTMPIKNMVAIKINKSRYKEVPFFNENKKPMPQAVRYKAIKRIFSQRRSENPFLALYEFIVQ